IVSTHRAYLMLLAVLLFTASARTATAQSMPPINNPTNGHWYQAVLVAGAINWDDARVAAQSLSYSGFHGHLVTMTSAAENDFPHSAGLDGYVVEYEPTPIGTGPLLSIQPNPVVGGQPASGQVILAQPAGLGGVILTLTSSNPAAAVVPASVTVPTGANTFS